MWMTMMMGCGDYGSDQFNKSDSLRLNGRKLRPLIPRPTATTPNPIPSNKKSSTLPNPSSNCTRIHKANLSTLNANLAAMKDESKSDKTTAVPSVTTRWSPTPEQLYALKEMYRRGVRAPTTDQIHQIAAKLCRFGKIEGKNVFYWFQNHKARERQRHRRMLFHMTTCQEQPQCHFKSPETKISRFEIVQTKNNATSSNSSTLSEESVAVSENGTDQRWIHFQKERELQLKPYSTPHIHFSPTTTSTETTPEASGINKFDDERREIQTLELFPIRNNDCRVRCINMTEVQPMAAMDPSFAPNRLFGFLPVKKN